MLHIVYKMALRRVARLQFPPQSGEKKGSDPCTTRESGQAVVLPTQLDGKKGFDLVPLRELARLSQTGLDNQQGVPLTGWV